MGSAGVVESSERERRPSVGLCAVVLLVAACVGAGAALLPTKLQGGAPRPPWDTLLAARTFAQDGVASIEDGHGVMLGRHDVAAGAERVPTGIGNRGTLVFYGLAMRWLPALGDRPELLAAALAALATLFAAACGLRHGWFEGALTGAAFAVLPIVWLGLASPAHIDLALAATGVTWWLVLTRRRPSLAQIALAGGLAGVAALGRNSFVVLAGLAALALLGRFADEERTPWRSAWVGAVLLVGVAAAVFVLGGGTRSAYTDTSLRGLEMSRLGHAFPDFVTYELWRDASPAEREAHPLLAPLDPRLASIYGGEGDTAKGVAGKLLVRAPKSLSFYPRAGLMPETFGGPIVLLLVLAGVVWGSGACRRVLVLGSLSFLAFHSLIGTSNESHLAVFGAPVALAIAFGVRGASRRLAGEGGRGILLATLFAAALGGHLLFASKAAMSHHYHGAGGARYGVLDSLRASEAVAEAGAEPAVRVAIGRRPEDAMAVAWGTEHSTFLLSPVTVLELSKAGALRAQLESRRIELALGYEGEAAEHLTRAGVRVLAVPWREVGD